MREAFLQAICETPQDDAPRLVYADWLEDHGDEHDRARATFIRGQCRLEHLPQPQGYHPAPEYQTLLASLAEHGPAWLAREFPLPPGWHLRDDPQRLFALWRLPEAQAQVTFRRGFVDTVRCACKDWLEHGASLVGANPVHTATLFGCMEPLTGPLPDEVRRTLEQTGRLPELLQAGTIELYAWVWMHQHGPTRRLKRLVLTDVDAELLGYIQLESFTEGFPGVEVLFANETV